MTDVPEYFLTSERLSFRHWMPEDLSLAMQLWGDPAVTRLIDSRGALSETDVLQRLSDEIRSQATEGVSYWPVFLLSTTEFVGCCGLRTYPPDRSLLELGVHICRPHWGQGIATEAGSAVIDHAFRALKVSGLFAGHHPDNSASRKVLEKLGFSSIGTRFYEPTGLHHPSYILNRK